MHLAQRYVEEGLRHDAHPLIHFLDGPSGRCASLLDRGLDVWEVIATVCDNNGSVKDAADHLQVPAGMAEAAVAYYGECRDEIDREIALSETEYERCRGPPPGMWSLIMPSAVSHSHRTGGSASGRPGGQCCS